MSADLFPLMIAHSFEKGESAPSLTNLKWHDVKHLSLMGVRGCCQAFVPSVYIDHTILFWPIASTAYGSFISLLPRRSPAPGRWAMEGGIGLIK